MTLTFCDAIPSQIDKLWEILSLFEAMSGLLINLDKSWKGAYIEELVALLGCRQSSLSITYLGLPLGAKFKDRVIWNSILERLE